MGRSVTWTTSPSYPSDVGTSVTLQGYNGYYVTVVGGQPIPNTLTASQPLTGTVVPGVSISPGSGVTIVPAISGPIDGSPIPGGYLLIIGAGATGVGSSGSTTSPTGDSITWSVNSDGTCTVIDTTTGQSINISPGGEDFLGGMDIQCF